MHIKPEVTIAVQTQVLSVFSTLVAQVDMCLGEHYNLRQLLPGCMLVGAGVLLCTL